MLQKFNITPYVIILFFFGLTLIPVSLASADERAAFTECEQMPTQPNNYKSLKRQKNCFRDVAKRLGAKQSARREFRACQKIKPNRVSTQKMQQKIDCFMDVASSLMPDMAPPAGAPGMPPTMAPQQEVEQQAAQADADGLPAPLTAKQQQCVEQLQSDSRYSPCACMPIGTGGCTDEQANLYEQEPIMVSGTEPPPLTEQEQMNQRARECSMWMVDTWQRRRCIEAVGGNCNTDTC